MMFENKQQAQQCFCHPLDQWIGLYRYGTCPKQNYSNVKSRKFISPIFDSAKCFPSGSGSNYWYAPEGVQYIDFVYSALTKYSPPAPLITMDRVQRRLMFFKRYFAPFHQSVNDEFLFNNAVEAFYSRPMTGADGQLFHRPKYGNKRIAGVLGSVQYAQDVLDQKISLIDDWLRGGFPVTVMHKEEPLPSSKETARGLGIRSTEEHILEVFFFSKLFEVFKGANASNSCYPWVFGCDININTSILYGRLPSKIVCRDTSRQDSSQLPSDFSGRIDLLIHLLDLGPSRVRTIYGRYPYKHLKKLVAQLIGMGCVSLLSTKWGVLYLKKKGLISGDFVTLFFNCLHNMEKHVDYLIEIGWDYDRIVLFLALSILLGDDACTPPHDDEARFHKFCYSEGVHIESSNIMDKKDLEFIGHKIKFMSHDFDGNPLVFPHPVFVPIDYNKMSVNAQHIDPTLSVQIAYDHLMGSAAACSADRDVSNKIAEAAHGLAKSYPFLTQRPITSDDLNYGHGLTAVPRLAPLN